MHLVDETRLPRIRFKVIACAFVAFISVAYTGAVRSSSSDHCGFEFFKDEICCGLSRALNDPDLIRDTWAGVVHLLRNRRALVDIGFGPGVVYAKDLGKNLPIDWSALGIPYEHATIWLRGRSFSYRDFIESELETVSVGFGYRKRITFRLGESDRAAGKWAFTKAIVECE